MGALIINSGATKPVESGHIQFHAECDLPVAINIARQPISLHAICHGQHARWPFDLHAFDTPAVRENFRAKSGAPAQRRVRARSLPLNPTGKPRVIFDTRTASGLSSRSFAFDQQCM